MAFQLPTSRSYPAQSSSNMAFLSALALIFAIVLQGAFSINNASSNSTTTTMTTTRTNNVSLNSTTTTTTTTTRTNNASSNSTMTTTQPPTAAANVSTTLTVTTTTALVKILGPDRPTGMNEKYTQSMDPSQANGYANSSQRVGAYWPLRFNNFTAFQPLNGGRSRPPSLQLFDSTKSVNSTPGVETQLSANSDPTAAAVRFLGDIGTGLVIRGFTDPADACFTNSLQCTLKNPNDGNATGITLSFWLKVPVSLDSETRYILDTGGDVNGQPGISITYQVADTRQDDRDTPQIELRHTGKMIVFVSTGSYTYTVTAQAQVRQQYWNNVAVRFSTDSDALGRPYGLQVFVNGTSIGWKRFPSTATNYPQKMIAPADMSVAVGCSLNGSGVFIGSMENLAVWYWRLTDAALNGSNLPANVSQLGELKYLDGDYTFAAQLSNVTPKYMPADWTPWAYDDWRYRQSGAYDTNQTFLDDTSPPIPDDCSTDKGCSCIDTPDELRTYLHFCEDADLVEAMIRVTNKAGTTGLTASDAEYIFGLPYNTSRMDLASMPLMTLADAEPYGNIIFVGSKLQESDIYGDLWKEETDSGGVGISLLPSLNDDYLHQLLNDTFERSTAPYKQKLMIVAANESAAMGLKSTVVYATSNIQFPDYDLQMSSGEYEYPFRFADYRKSWGNLNDTVTLSSGAFAQAYTDQKQVVTIVAQIHNQLGDHVRAFLDDRVVLSESAQLFVNSRILSLTIRPPPTMLDALETFPVWILFEHFEQQPDLPYEKGALMCVTWNYNEINESSLGGWDTDGCTLVSTNDTHSTCACTRFGAYALLAEQHVPKGRMPDSAYNIVHWVYILSIVLLLLFMFIVVVEETLHYEVHIIHANAALAMTFALLSYVASWTAYNDRIGCIFVSITMHYSFTAAYLWCAISAHYLFRAITAGKLGSRIFIKYCIVGWGFPAIIVIIFCAIDVSKYGLGERCLGAHKDYFLWIYIGVFVALCFIVMPLCGIGFCNLPTMPIRDIEDRIDICWSLIGTTLFWPVIMVVWVMAMFVYLIPQENQLYDFLFEVFNSVQGIAMFILFGLMVPPFRDTILCCTPKRKPNRDRIDFRIRMYLEYYK